MADLSRDEPKYSLLQTLGLVPGTAVCFFAVLAFELWRLGPNKKVLPPSLSLKPWHMPLGLAQFIFVTFSFASLWALGFVIATQSGYLQQPLQFLSMSVGGLIAIWGVYRAFPSKFAA